MEWKEMDILVNRTSSIVAGESYVASEGGMLLLSDDFHSSPRAFHRVASPTATSASTTKERSDTRRLQTQPRTAI
jgi:hypothetical protein